MRLGLCCIFNKEPIRFRTTTVRYVSSLPHNGIEHLNTIVLHNLESLIKALTFCKDNGIGAFRVLSGLLPLYTHPIYGYPLEKLPDAEEIKHRFSQAKREAENNDLRITFHPDQFVVLNSPKEEVVTNAIAEIEYHTLLASLLGGDVINIHGGGGYGDKRAALERFKAHFKRLSTQARSYLTIENDDKVYTPADLIPLCKQLHIPFVYDVHHHRCLPDGQTIQKTTERALETWNREPLFHLSSPKEGWGGKNPKLHHDYIDIKDFPKEWSQLSPLTIDVEAKAKECAVLRLKQEMRAS